MVWEGSLVSGTDLSRLESGTLTAMRYQVEILGPIVRTLAGPVGLGSSWWFLYDERTDPTDWPLHIYLWHIMFCSVERHQVAPETVQELSDALVQIKEEIPQDTICPDVVTLG